MGTRLSKILSVVGVIALIALVAGLAAGPDRRRQACIATGLCNSQDFLGAMLVSVQRQQKHIVLSARLVAPITAGRDTTLGPVTIATTRATAIVPATVHYAVDFSQLAETDLNWDAATRTLTVRRPPVITMPPAIEWDKAQLYSDKGLIPAVTDIRQRLQQDQRDKAPGIFRAQAASEDLLRIANDAADDALQSLFLMPLLAIGHDNPTVRVIRQS